MATALRPAAPGLIGQGRGRLGDALGGHADALDLGKIGAQDKHSAVPSAEDHPDWVGATPGVRRTSGFDRPFRISISSVFVDAMADRRPSGGLRSASHSMKAGFGREPNA